MTITRIFALGLCAGACVSAQETVAAPRLRIEAQHKVAAEAGVMGMGMHIVSAEFGVEGKTVKGAPYSAQITTETTQTLADGNRIHNRTSSSVARDSAGRTRRDQTIKMMGPWASSGEKPASLVVINDPDAQVSYMLESDTHVARKTSFVRSDLAAEKLQFRREHTVKLAAEQSDSDVELLGSKMIEGVSADGKRTTRTIPAGQIGNDKPIQIVNEVWFSPDLQVIVMSKHSDPQIGETVYTLTNIQRAEPDPALFTVPADYVVKDAAALPFGAKDQIFYFEKHVK